MTDTTPEAVARLAVRLNREGSWRHFDGGGLDEGADPAPHHAAAMLTALSAEVERLRAEQKALIDANFRQALCIHNTAAAFGPEYSATVDALPKGAVSIRSERDQARADLAEAEKLWDLVNLSYDITGSLEAGCEHGFRPAATCPNADCESGNIHRTFLGKIAAKVNP